MRAAHLGRRDDQRPTHRVPLPLRAKGRSGPPSRPAIAYASERRPPILVRVSDPERDALISLCERVLSAEMTVDELQRDWPGPVENPALVSLREALEDGIEHTPVDSTGGLHERRWQQTPEYDDIAFYLQRLREAKH